MYPELMRALARLISALSRTPEIDIRKAANAYSYYASKITSGFDYSISYNVGDVCWIEFGNNFKPEMSYKHMGIIIRKFDKMYFVIPITTISLNNNLMATAYHPLDNPTGNDSYYKLKASDFSFLQHDSVLKISEVKGVSVKRIKSRCSSIEQTDLQLIEKRVLARYFPWADIKIKNLEKENSLLKMTIEASKIMNVYEVSVLTDLYNLIEIDTTTYSLFIGTPNLIAPAQYEIEIKLTDKYNQEISKIVQYNLITE